MSKTIELKAKDGHRFAAYRAEPATAPRGGLVVVQEIFGVNQHMRNVCDDFAADGFVAVAPALFDRVERGVDIGYSADDVARGRAIRAKMNWDHVMAEVAAAIAAVAGQGRVGIAGYCYGGGVAWVAGCRLKGLSAAVGYYGGPWSEFAREKPQCPTLLHFGAKDGMVPVSLAETMRAAHSAIATRVYDADHGFNCDQRANHDAFAATVARGRTLAFFTAVIG